MQGFSLAAADSAELTEQYEDEEDGETDGRFQFFRWHRRRKALQLSSLVPIRSERKGPLISTHKGQKIPPFIAQSEALDHEET